MAPQGFRPGFGARLRFGAVTVLLLQPSFQLLEAVGALLGMVLLKGWTLVGKVFFFWALLYGCWRLLGLCWGWYPWRACREGFFLLDVVVWDTKGVHTKKRQRNKQTIKQTNKRTQPNTQRSNGKKQRPKGGTKHERRSSTKGGRTKRKEEDHL